GAAGVDSRTARTSPLAAGAATARAGAGSGGRTPRPSAPSGAGFEPGAGAGSGAVADGVPDGSIVPTAAPMSTVCPSATPIFSTPEPGAGTTVVALSVSSSRSGSPAWTEEPSAFSQRDTIPSEIDSPTLGTVIGMADIMHSQLSVDRVEETRCGTAAPTAASTISACSRSWTALEPVAGLALASRPTYGMEI